MKKDEEPKRSGGSVVRHTILMAYLTVGPLSLLGAIDTLGAPNNKQSQENARRRLGIYEKTAWTRSFLTAGGIALVNSLQGIPFFEALFHPSAPEVAASALFVYFILDAAAVSVFKRKSSSDKRA